MTKDDIQRQTEDRVAAIGYLMNGLRRLEALVEAAQQPDHSGKLHLNPHCHQRGLGNGWSYDSFSRDEEDHVLACSSRLTDATAETKSQTAEFKSSAQTARTIEERIQRGGLTIEERIILEAHQDPLLMDCQSAWQELGACVLQCQPGLLECNDLQYEPGLECGGMPGLECSGMQCGDMFIQEPESRDVHLNPQCQSEDGGIGLTWSYGSIDTDLGEDPSEEGRFQESIILKKVQEEALTVRETHTKRRTKDRVSEILSVYVDATPDHRNFVNHCSE